MQAIDNHLSVRRRTTTCGLLVALALTGGCGGSSNQDKAGNEKQVEPVELVVANHEGGEATLTAWVQTVERLSKGSIKVRASNGWRKGETNYEQATVGDVRGRKVELATIAARGYDELGVTSFQPLLAPLLIDTPELERRVLLGDVGRNALAGAQKLGIVGLALLPTDLRRPVGLSRSLVAPQDYQGARVYTREGKIARATFETLGARPVHLSTEDWFKSVDGAEVSLAAISGQRELPRRAARIAANVVLWPQTTTIVMNKKAFNELSDEQQKVLKEAAAATIEPAARMVSDKEQKDQDNVCRFGAEYIQATPSQLTALEAAVQPVYGMIERAAGNAEAVATIRKLKGDSRAPTLACPTDATGDSDGQAPASGAARKAAELEGTYRVSLAEKELADSPLLYDQGEINDQNWGQLTLKLSDGRVRYSQTNNRDQFQASGQYETNGDVIRMQFDELGETWGFRWSLYRGTLELERDKTLGVPPELHAPTPMLVKPWRRVG